MKKMLYKIIFISWLASVIGCQGMEEIDVEDFLKHYHNELHYAVSFDVRGDNPIIVVGKDCVCIATTFIDKEYKTKKSRICLYRKRAHGGQWIEEHNVIFKDLITAGMRIVENSAGEQRIIMLCEDLNPPKRCQKVDFGSSFGGKRTEQCFIQLDTNLKEIKFDRAFSKDNYRIYCKPRINDDQFDAFGERIVFVSWSYDTYSSAFNKLMPHQGFTVYDLNGNKLKKEENYNDEFAKPIKKIRICNVHSIEQKKPSVIAVSDASYAYSLADFKQIPFEDNIELNDEGFDVDSLRETIFYRGNCSYYGEGWCLQLKQDEKKPIDAHFKQFGYTPHQWPIFGTTLSHLQNKITGNTISIESMQSYDGKSCVRTESPGIFSARRQTLFYQKDNFDTNERTQSNAYSKGRTLPVPLYPMAVLSSAGVVGVKGKKVMFLDSTASHDNMQKIVTATANKTLPSLQKEIDKETIEKANNSESWWWGKAKKIAPYALAVGITYLGYQGVKHYKQQGSPKKIGF